MPTFRLPLSGNVAQTINPLTWFFNAMGSQFGLVNINLGKSSDPAVEEEILEDVASYGKQLGRIEDALIVLIDNFPAIATLKEPEQKAIKALRDIVVETGNVKRKHARNR